MHSPTRPNADGVVPQPGPTRTEPDGELSAELQSVLAGARRRAVRGGDRQLDTAHLLHSLLESDPAVRAVFGDGARVARLLGLLVQRSIGYGLRWQGTVEDSGAVPVVRELPAVRDFPGVRDRGAREGEGWSPAALTALHLALSRAHEGGRETADGLDLLAALACDPECRAVEILRRSGVDPWALADRIDSGCGEPFTR
ncbi:Clp protease N-terminal domain-containing protein [Streptomyces indicus]|uniref:Clp protease N-terminal domain-containing protein n=1 Tax=Streptomyces indicus TaxID=417292 RepID=UPI000D1BA530|nr:Clp protease N-terminal domain-containing protein [Streptomyces indicus]